MSENTGSVSMSFADYCALNALNWSLLKFADASAYHFREAELDGRGIETDPMRLGRGFHTLVLEPDTFGDLYAVWSGGDRRGNEWKAFKAEHASRTILTEDQASRARKMAAAVRRHPEAVKALSRGRAEQTLVWTDEPTGLACKARADFLSYYATVWDLKSYADASPKAIVRATHERGYPCQLAHYCMGAQASGYYVVEPRAGIIAVESRAPHDVGVFELETEALNFGKRRVRELLDLVARCRDADEWPGRYPQLQAWSLPEWAKQAPEIIGSEED